MRRAQREQAGMDHGECLQSFLAQAAPGLGLGCSAGAVGVHLEGYLQRSGLPDLVATGQFGKHN